MREHLLGYLLGALDPAEQELVERRLEADPELRRQLGLLEKRLDGLKCLHGNDQPPPGLAERTCNRIHGPESENRFLPPPAAGSGSARRADAAHQPQPAFSSPPETTAGGRWSLADMLVAASLVLAAAALLFPALASTRNNSRRLACENNLQSLAVALASYSELYEGRFPQIPTKGNLAVAGSYAAFLRHHDLLRQQNLLVCPGSQLARRREKLQLPSLPEIEQASGAMLATVQRELGGSYGYSLGYIEKDVYQGPRNRGRHNFALLADAPLSNSTKRQSPNHGGCGQNVLFEDLSVRYVVGCTLAQLGDDIFLNDDGLVAPGKTPNDSVLAESGTAPLVELSLRR